MGLDVWDRVVREVLVGLTKSIRLNIIKLIYATAWNLPNGPLGPGRSGPFGPGGPKRKCITFIP